MIGFTNEKLYLQKLNIAHSNNYKLLVTCNTYFRENNLYVV